MDRINGSNQIRKMSVNPADSRMDLQPPPPPDESYWSALLREGDGTTNGGARHSARRVLGMRCCAKGRAQPAGPPATLVVTGKALRMCFHSQPADAAMMK